MPSKELKESQESKEEPKEELKKEISWRAAEFHYMKKNFGWYFVIVSLGVILVIFALIQKNFLFAVFIILAELIIIFSSQRRPRILDFRITNEGVGIGKEIFYPYEAIESFSIYERPYRLNELVIKRKVMINPYVRLPIDAKLAEEARKLLSEKLVEVKYEPSVIDVLSDLLGF